MMPRTVMVFINEEEGLSPTERSEGLPELRRNRLFQHTGVPWKDHESIQSRQSGR